MYLQALGVCYAPKKITVIGTEHPSDYNPEDTRAHVFVFNRKVFLSEDQALILEFLMIHQGKFLTRENILDEFDDTGHIDDRCINQLVRRLRKKLFPNNPMARMVFIQTKYNVGYRIPTREQLNHELVS